jgi:SNF2 family DNA or RNA helicase
MLKIEYENKDHRRILITASDGNIPRWQQLKFELLDLDQEESKSIRKNIVSIPSLSFFRLYHKIFEFNDAMDYPTPEISKDIIDQIIKFDQRREKISSPSSKDEKISHDEIKTRIYSSGWQIEKINPTDFQLNNLGKMCLFPEGAASFSVPGAGKTIEGCAFFAFHKEANSKMIVVLPRVGYIAWEEELDKCLGLKSGKDIVRIDGRPEENAMKISSNSEAVVFLITYERFTRNTNLMFDILSKNSCFLVLDESHRIKNDSLRSDAVLSLSNFADFRLILSGTPIPNATEDIERQFEFLYPGLDWPLDKIVSKMKDIQVRTKKSDLGLLKPLEYTPKVSMNSLQREIYDAISDHEFRSLITSDLNDRNNLAILGQAVITVIQAASNPMLLLKNPRVPKEIKEKIGILVQEEGSEIFPKIDWVCKKARELVNSGEKVIIWSSFVENVKLIDAKLKDLGSRYILGETPSISGQFDEIDESKISRESIIHGFRNMPFRRILVANPSAAGESISLHHACRHAIYVDRTYNAGNFVQSRDRIHRYGEKDGKITCSEVETYYYYLTTERSIDEMVNSSLSRKITNMARMLDDDSLIFEPLGIPNPDGNSDFGFDDKDITSLRNFNFGDNNDF